LALTLLANITLGWKGLPRTLAPVQLVEIKNLATFNGTNGIARFEKCKQLLEYQNNLLLRDI
jgi:hypothetical protein